MHLFPRLALDVFPSMLELPEKYLNAEQQGMLRRVLGRIAGGRVIPLPLLQRIRQEIDAAESGTVKDDTASDAARRERCCRALLSAAFSFLERECGNRTPNPAELSLAVDAAGSRYFNALVRFLPKVQTTDRLTVIESIITRTVDGLDTDKRLALRHVVEILAKLHFACEERLRDAVVALHGEELSEDVWPAHVFAVFSLGGGLKLLLP